MTNLPPNAIRLYHRDTPAGRDLYQVVSGERVSRVQTGAFERRVTTGPVSADAEQLISSWAQDDYSGGFGIKDGNESTDTARISFGVIDPRRPKSMVLPPQTDEIAPPGGATGFAYPLGDVGSNFYFGWDNMIVGWDADAQDWHATHNSWPGGFVIYNRPVSYCGYLWIPGDTGLAVLSESNPANGTLTVESVVGTDCIAACEWDGKLMVLNADRELWQITPSGVASSHLDTGWTQLFDGFGNEVLLDYTMSVTELVNYYNAALEETLWAICRGRGAYLYNSDNRVWIKSTVRGDGHPDWGLSAEVFRDGEDMFISAGGLDVTRFTNGQVEVPISGPSKDQGPPPAYYGTILDLCSERSTLYGIVRAGVAPEPIGAVQAFAQEDSIGGTGSTTDPLKFNTPYGIALDADGNIFVADWGNRRILKLDETGAFVKSVGITECYDIAVDASGNVYAPTTNDIRKYDNDLNLTLTKSNITGSSNWFTFCDTDSTHLWVSNTGSDTIYKLLCTTLATVHTFGGAGTGNGLYDDPAGIAVDGTHVYVVDNGNDRVQKHLKSTGAYAAQWGSSGVATGSFDYPADCCLDASGDVWVADYNNNRCQRFSNAGVYQTSFSVSRPASIALTDDDDLWVSSTSNTLSFWVDQLIPEQEVVETKNWLAAWTGTAWCALWEGTTGDAAPTILRVSLTGDYALWWGDEDGNVFRQLIPPPFFNPAARMEYRVYPFATTGWMETIRFDAQMSGWDKIASHAFAQMDYASATDYVDVSYRTDADQFESGLLDPPYRLWKRVDHIGRTIMWFDDTEIDPISGQPWREGEPFQWIQFRFDFYRGGDDYRSPVWMWHSLHFLSVPQDNASITLKVPITDAFNRSADEIATTLRGLQTERAMLHLQISNPRPGHPEWQTFFRGRVTKVNSEFYPGANNKLDEVLVLNFIEVGASSNENTTVAPAPVILP